LRWSKPICVACPFSSAHCGSDFSGLDFVLEIVWIETIEAAGGGLSLRIHKKRYQRAACAGKSDIVRKVAFA
jgi:hypothetical protein